MKQAELSQEICLSCGFLNCTYFTFNAIILYLIYFNPVIYACRNYYYEYIKINYRKVMRKRYTEYNEYDNG